MALPSADPQRAGGDLFGDKARDGIEIDRTFAVDTFSRLKLEATMDELLGERDEAFELCGLA